VQFAIQQLSPAEWVRLRQQLKSVDDVVSPEQPAQRAVAKAHGESASRWVRNDSERKPAQRATEGSSAHKSFSSDIIERDAVARCAGLRVVALRTHGSRTRRGLYAVAHFVGLRVSRCVPTARGLAVGFVLSPTSWAEPEPRHPWSWRNKCSRISVRGLYL